MGVLDRISSPADLRSLSEAEMETLASEIRTFLIEKVAATGGHLGPNLGVVELTLGIHRVFDSPHDPILFDTGHQCYVHKIVTGRKDGFDELRQRGGLTGYQERAESEHDWIESSHASAAMSYADGLAKSFRADRPARPHRGRGGRRRRPHRRHVLGGDQQHRRLQPTRRDRRQRQRPLLRPRPSAVWRATFRVCACSPDTRSSSTRAAASSSRCPSSANRPMRCSTA